MAAIDSLLKFLGLGKTAGNVRAATMAPALGKTADDANARITQNQQLQKQLFQQIRNTSDPAKKQKLLEQSRLIDQGTQMAGQNAGQMADQVQSLGNITNNDLTKSNARFALERGAKSAAELGSYAVPFGKGANLLTRVLAPGAATGALSTAASDKVTPASLALGALGGATGAGILHGATKGLSKLAGSGAERLSNSIFREPIKETKAAIKSGTDTLGQQALKKGTKGLSSEGIFKDAIENIESFENKLQESLKTSTRIIPVGDIKNAVKPLIKKYTDAGNLNAVNNITTRIEALESAHGKSIPVSVANEVKRTLYDEARNGYGQLASENMEGIKSIARALKEGIASKVKGAGDINKELSYYGRIADSMTDKLARGGRNNLLGLAMSAITGGGIAAAPTTMGASMLPALLLGALGTTGGKKLTSNALQGVSSGAMNPATQQVLEQLGSRSGSALTKLVGNIHQNNQNTGTEVGQVPLPGTNLIGEGSDPALNNNNQQAGPQPEPNAGGNMNVQNTPSSAQGGNFDDIITQLQGQGVSPEIAQQFAAGLSQRQAPQNELSGINISPEMAAAAQLFLSPENAKKIQSAYTIQQQATKNKPLTVAAEKSKRLGESGLRALNEIDTILKEDPNAYLKATLPGKLGARKYDSAAFRAVESLLRERSGAAVPETEVRRYMNANLPRLGDTAEEAQFKLNAFRRDIEAIANAGEQGGTETDQLLQLLLQQGLNLQ